MWSLQVFPDILSIHHHHLKGAGTPPTSPDLAVLRPLLQQWLISYTETSTQYETGSILLCYCFCFISTSMKRTFKHFLALIKTLSPGEGLHLRNLIKRNQFFGVRVIQLISAYVKGGGGRQVRSESSTGILPPVATYCYDNPDLCFYFINNGARNRKNFLLQNLEIQIIYLYKDNLFLSLAIRVLFISI